MISQAIAVAPAAPANAPRHPSQRFKRPANKERHRPGDADAGGVAGDGARHERGFHAVGQELEAGHVRAGPAHAGQDACRGGAPGPVGEPCEADVARHGEADTGQIDRAGVDRSVSVTRNGTDTVYAAQKSPVIQPACPLVMCQPAMNSGSSAGQVYAPI
jgi:hypothetical protein